MIEITFYKLPNGTKEIVQAEIFEDDEVYFKEKCFKLSAEVLRTNELAVYSTTGVIVDGEEIEEMFICHNNESVQTAFKELRKQVEEFLKS